MLQGLDAFYKDVVDPIRKQVTKEQEANVNLQIENGLLLAKLDKMQRVLDQKDDLQQELNHKRRLVDLYEDRIHELDDQVYELEKKLAKQAKKLAGYQNYEKWAEQTIADYEVDAMIDEWHDANCQLMEEFEQQWIEQQIELYEADSE